MLAARHGDWPQCGEAGTASSCLAMAIAVVGAPTCEYRFVIDLLSYQGSVKKSQFQ